ncbi:MAG: LysR family transcriptional regulator [Sporolactobacillus sp.]
MTFRHLRIFIAVCDTMNMTVAAEHLFMSQPAVSQAISDLEKHYGVRLFERLSRKLYLTQAGRKLLISARQILHMNRHMENEMRNLLEGALIRIGASVTIGAYVLPKLVAHFKSEHTQVQVQVVEDNTTQIEKLILKDQLDLALVEGETTASELVLTPFLEDELILICGTDHPFASLSSVRPEMLQKEAIIIREKGSGTRKTFEDAMAAANLSWRPSWTCNNADTIKMAVAEGLGISVISRRAVAREVAAGWLHIKKVDGLSFKRQFKLIYHQNKYLTEAMTAFITLATEK